MTPDVSGSYGIYLFHYEEASVKIRVDRITEDKKSLWGELTITVAYPPDVSRWRHLHHEGFNLLSGVTRKRIARMLSDMGPSTLEWDKAIEQVCVGVINRQREGEPPVRTGDIALREGSTYRIEPVIEEGVPTLLYGYGGSGKSYFAAFLASIMDQGYLKGPYTPEPGPVLWLDYENSDLEHAERMHQIHNGLGVDTTSNILYRFCHQRLANEAEELLRMVLEHNVGLVVVDSAGPACGGEPETAQAAIQFFMGLRRLRYDKRAVSSLILAHKTKIESKGPFGSVYFWNYPRNVYRLDKAQGAGESSVHLALFHEKSNNGSLQRPQGFHMQFSQDATGTPLVAFEPEDIKKVAEFSNALPLAERISQALHNGALTVNSIAEELEAKGDVVRTTLNRFKGERFIQMGDKWGLSVT